MDHSTAPAIPDTPKSPDPGEQLRLRFFAAVEGYRGTPPDRALMRELLECALRGVERFTVGARTIAASVVHHVGLALYCRADRAGIVEGFKVDVLAADTRRGERSVRDALTVLRRLRCYRSTRDQGRRRPAVHRINVGGLDWPGVRERAKVDASAVRETGLSARPVRETGLRPVRETALKGYNEGHDVRAGEGSDSDRTSLLEIAREGDPAFAPDSAFLPAVGLCPSCEQCETLNGAVCSRCSPSGRPSEGGPSGRGKFTFVAGTEYDGEPVYAGRPSADWNEGGDP